MEFIVKQIESWPQTKSDCLVFLVPNKKTLSPELKELDQHCNGLISNLNKSSELPKSAGQTTLLHTSNKNFPRILLAGIGSKPTLASWIKTITALNTVIKKTPCKNIAFVCAGASLSDANEEQLLQQIAYGLENGNYAYAETLSKKPKKSALKKATVLTAFNSRKAKTALQEGRAMGIGAKTARELGNLPPNICTPSYLAKEANKLAKQYEKLSSKSLSEAQMKKLGMNSLLSVTAGTEEPAKLIIMEYKGGSANSKPQVLVGKGVTFDSGGISLKPGAKMDEMKYDMCGAASVFGTITAAAELGLKKNIVAIVGAVENLPSGKATKPGDIVTSMSGQTIEILNTDAEGRLVLCDALTYAGRYKPAAVIDIATLTGACVVALGKHASGLYSNNDALSSALKEAGDKTHDRAWPMPLWEDYNKQLHSNFADMANIGGPEGGSVTAACFLSRFTKEYNWAHLDIAGAAWVSGGAKGATGRPVRLLTQYLIDC